MRKPLLVAAVLAVLALGANALADKTITCDSAFVTATQLHIMRGPDAGWFGEGCGTTRAKDGGTMRGAEGCAPCSPGAFGNVASVCTAALVAELCP